MRDTVVMSTSDVAEMLYATRLALECGGKRAAFGYLLEGNAKLLTAILRDAGHDPGKTALEADALKLRIIDPRRRA